jgi:hypothetical protein
VIEKIGGRGRDLTGGPLLAKQIGQKSKCLFWCRLRAFGRLLIRTMIPSLRPKFPAEQDLRVMRTN